VTDRTRRALRPVGLVALIGIGLLLFGQRIVESIIFQPSPGIEYPPARFGIDAEETWLTTEDGVRIHSFFLPAAQAASRAVLFLHGNAGNASHRLPNAALLAALGADVLLLDYRGYGASEGSPSEAGVYADARAGLAHLVEERRVPLERVVLFGRSLGGAVAVDLAQERPLAGVILESTFSSLRALARHAVGPLGGLIVRRGFDSLDKIGRARAPLLFFHGDRDEVVDWSLGRALFDAAPEPKAFETLRGAGHNDTVVLGGTEYLERIRSFLDEVAP
jgi:fermentation-respiration switch protein FrsA (DUF1100 family)